MSNITISDIREKVSNAILYLTVKELFVGTFTRLTRIVFVPSSARAIAWTDGDTIYITPAAVKLTTKELAFVLAHESLHIVMMHTKRMKPLMRKYPRLLINIAADAIVNEHILSLLPQSSSLNEKIITCDSFPDNAHNVRRRCKEGASMEELTELLYTLLSTNSIDVNIDIDLGGEEGRENEGEVVNEGEGEGGEKGGEEGRENEGEVVNEGEGEGGERERRIIKRIIKAHTLARIAGHTPAWADRLITEILRPKIDWRILLRTSINSINAKKIRRTWSRQSRKIPDAAPGKVLYGAKILILLDTSGSIDEKTLSQFMSEIYAAAREAEITLVPWDAVAYQPIRIRRPSDVKNVIKNAKIVGGGGTLIRPALEFATKVYNNNDIMIIMSDWYISDLHDDDVQYLLKKLKYKIIAVTVGADPPPFLRHIRLSI
ncbi:MAG: VWA-like domain-containing protein [Desulfurococcaceae archaeon]